MTRFVETDKGYINLAFVGKIAHWQRGDKRFSTLYAPDGEVLGDTRAVLDMWDIEHLSDPIIPAPVASGMWLESGVA
jgi:hypothetical protein